MSKFVEQITKAFEVAQAQKQRHQERQDAITEDIVRKKLDSMGVTEFLVIGRKVKVGGVTFRATFYDGEVDGWQVKGNCLKCGHRCWSIAHSDLAGVGKMYLDFKPDFVHQCPPTQQTAEGKLVAALCDFIDERTQNNEY